MTDRGTDERDPFHFSSGLADDIDVTLGEGVFRTDASYNNGQTLLLALDWECDDPEISTESPLLYPCGSGWEAYERGLKARSEDGNERRSFNNSTSLAHFVKAAFDAGAEDVIRDRAGSDGAKRADIWKGLRFHMERKEYGKGQYRSEKLVPTKYLGAGEDDPGKSLSGSGTITPAHQAPVPSEGGAKRADPPPADAPASGGGGGAGGLSTKLRVKLRDAAKKVKGEGGDHDAFVELAYTIDGTGNNPAADEAIMDEGEESIWGMA